MYTPKNTHVIQRSRLFAVRQRDSAERELNRRVAIYWRSFLYVRKKSRLLKENSHRERWVGLELASKLVSLDRMSCKEIKRKSIEARGEIREIPR